MGWSLRPERIGRLRSGGAEAVHIRIDDAYQSATLASERLTDEDWTEVPNGSVFQVDADGAFHREALHSAG